MWPAIMAAAPGIMSAAGGLAGLFGKKKKDPSKAGMKYLNNIQPSMSPYYQPYIDKGRAASESVNNEYNQQVSDPSAIYNKLGAGYKESPGYQFRLNQALQAGNQSQAAGGMLGTPQNQQQNMGIAGDQAGADFEKYLQNVIGIYKGGIAGQEGTAGRGYDASSTMGNAAGDIEGRKAEMAYNGADSMNKGNAQNWENITSGLGQAGTGYNAYNQQQKFMDMMQKFYNSRGA